VIAGELERFLAAEHLTRRADSLRVLQSVGRATDADRDAVKDADARWTLLRGSATAAALKSAAHRWRRRGGAQR
jgi:hypothetical protein